MCKINLKGLRRVSLLLIKTPLYNYKCRIMFFIKRYNKKKIIIKLSSFICQEAEYAKQYFHHERLQF